MLSANCSRATCSKTDGASQCTYVGVGGGVNTLKFHNGAAIVTNDPGGTPVRTWSCECVPH